MAATMTKPRRGIAVSCGRVFLEFYGLGLTPEMLRRYGAWERTRRRLTGPLTFREIWG